MEGCSSPINVKLAEGGGEEREAPAVRGVRSRRMSLQCEERPRWMEDTQKYFSPRGRLSLDKESVGLRQLVGPKDSNVFVYNLPVCWFWLFVFINGSVIISNSLLIRI